MKYRLHTHYSAGHSPVHHLDPRTKIVLTLLYVILVVSTPPRELLAFVIYGGLLSWAVALSQVPLRHILWRASAVLPFSVLAACWLPFFGPAPYVSFWGGAIELSDPGLWKFAGVAMKSFLGASAAIFMTTVTPFSALLAGLRRLGMPSILVDMLSLTYRYLFVLFEEAMRLRRAATARGYRPTWLRQALLIGRLIGQLFIRSYERAERVYGAMVLRGYQGQLPLTHALRFTKTDTLALLLLIPLLVAVRTLL